MNIVNFWQGKKVLLTGHTGFKGSWLTLWLRYLGANLSGISLPADQLSLYHIADIEEDVTSYFCDITQSFELLDTIHACKPEIIFHLAAQALVRPSYADPVSTFATNIMGTVHLLDAARQCDSVKLSSSLPAINVITIRNGHGGTESPTLLAEKTLIHAAKQALNLW